MQTKMITCDQEIELTDVEKKAYKTYKAFMEKNHPDTKIPDEIKYTRLQRNLKKARLGSPFSLVERAM